MKKKREYAATQPMYNPAHPGEVLKDAIIDALGLTVTEAAAHLDVDRITLSRVINKRASISVEMALRLSKALNTSAEVWLGMQQSYDLWEARKHKPDLSRVRRFKNTEPYAPM